MLSTQVPCSVPKRCLLSLGGNENAKVLARSITRRRSVTVRAARSTGREEREQALQQQWQEAGGDDGADYENGPYGNPYYNQQSYQQYPAYPSSYAPKTSSGFPYGWILFGAVLGFVVTKVMDFLSPSGGGPQAKMMNFMMKQALKGSGAGAGGAPAGFPDFSQLGNTGGFPGGFPGSGFPTPPSSSSRSASSAVVDTPARQVQQKTGTSAESPSPTPSAATASEGSSPQGAKFEEMKSRNRRRRRSGGGSEASAPASSFVDTEVEEQQAAEPAGPSGSGNGAGGAEGEDDEFTISMLEQFLEDPAMQEMLYQYLPEPMRNKETFEWMLKNPEYRDQLKSVLKAQGAQLNKEVYKQMQNVDNEEMRKQLAAHGITPAEVVQKIMAEPELAAAFSKPQVQQAVMEMQSNPMAIVKYQNDPDVMLVLEKMSQMFPEAGPQAMGSPGMPGAGQ